MKTIYIPNQERANKSYYMNRKSIDNHRNIIQERFSYDHIKKLNNKKKQ